MNRVKKCFGFPVWRRVELWVCLSGVPLHVHKDQAFEIMPLFGFATFYRDTPELPGIQAIEIGPKSWFRSFTVPSNAWHYFKTRFLVVLSISDKPNSAADNIQYA